MSEFRALGFCFLALIFAGLVQAEASVAPTEEYRVLREFEAQCGENPGSSLELNRSLDISLNGSGVDRLECRYLENYSYPEFRTVSRNGGGPDFQRHFYFLVLSVGVLAAFSVILLERYRNNESGKENFLALGLSSVPFYLIGFLPESLVASSFPGQRFSPIFLLLLVVVPVFWLVQVLRLRDEGWRRKVIISLIYLAVILSGLLSYTFAAEYVTTFTD